MRIYVFNSHKSIRGIRIKFALFALEFNTMKIAIIADIHDNSANLKKFLDWASENDIEAVVCCGDVTNVETISALSSGFDGNIYLVRGNMEIFEDEELAGFSNIDHGGRVAVWNIGGKKIGACHEPFLIDKVWEQETPDMVFYGHTHKPWEDKQNGAKVVNPGTLGGVFSEATFAVYDTESGELELKMVNRL